jgi:aminopeptidase N
MTQRVRHAVAGMVATTLVSVLSPVGVTSSPAAAAASASAAVSPASGAGSAGVGDVYYPKYGNGGYQVGHYDIHVAYNPGTHQLTGDTTISARTTQRLTSFHLDLLLTASRVWVDGKPARFKQVARHELVVEPTHALATRRALMVRVQYAGRPEQISVPSRLTGLGAGSTHPWLRAGDETFVNGEPEGATLWFPVNDHPLDKASYDINATVPRS